MILVHTSTSNWVSVTSLYHTRPPEGEGRRGRYENPYLPIFRTRLTLTARSGDGSKLRTCAFSVACGADGRIFSLGGMRDTVITVRKAV